MLYHRCRLVAPSALRVVTATSLQLLAGRMELYAGHAQRQAQAQTQSKMS